MIYFAAGGGSSTPSWGGTGGGVAMTGDQQAMMMQLEERDKDFDLQLDEIGEGIQDLAELANSKARKLPFKVKCSTE